MLAEFCTALSGAKFQDIQDFWDQYMVLCKVCSELGLRFGWSKDDEKAILAAEGVTYPNNEQLKESLYCVEEEQHY